MLGAFAASFVPDVWAMVATTVVQVMVGTAQEMQRRHRTNTFLDQMNEQLFKPRGLYAMIMTFKPDSSRPIDGQQIGINESIAKYSSHDSGRMREAMSSMRISSGTSYGELQIPQAAPLVYPALDEALLDEQGKKQNALKGAGKFVADYMDRRAQAKFVGNLAISYFATAADIGLIGVLQSKYTSSSRTTTTALRLAFLGSEPPRQ